MAELEKFLCNLKSYGFEENVNNFFTGIDLLKSEVDNTKGAIKIKMKALCDEFNFDSLTDLIALSNETMAFESELDNIVSFVKSNKKTVPTVKVDVAKDKVEVKVVDVQRKEEKVETKTENIKEYKEPIVAYKKENNYFMANLYCDAQKIQAKLPKKVNIFGKTKSVNNWNGVLLRVLSYFLKNDSDKIVNYRDYDGNPIVSKNPNDFDYSIKVNDGLLYCNGSLGSPRIFRILVDLAEKYKDNYKEDVMESIWIYF